jgi:hypothetical protein
MAEEEKEALMEPVVVPPGIAPTQFGIIAAPLDRVGALEERIEKLERLVSALAGHAS